MMKKIKYALITAFVGIVALAGCEQHSITAFEKDYSAVNFAVDSSSYSFLGNPTGEYVQDIPVIIMGDSAGYDRTFNVEVLNDEVTTAQKSDYEIMGGIVEAGQFHGLLKVKLFNSERLKDTLAVLHLKITESEDFTLGNAESDEIKLIWTNKIIVPPWTIFYKFFFCQYPSTTAYRTIVLTTGYKKIGYAVLGDIGTVGLRALGKKFGDYVRHYNSTHDEPLTHADGPAVGQPIVPVY